MKKELRPVHEVAACDVCGRTILKGERTETFLAPGGRRHEVCDLCFDRAEHAGWIREAVAGDTPTLPRAEPRRGLLSRLRRTRVGDGSRASPPAADPPAATAPQPEPEPAHEATPVEPPRRERTRPKDPRHVRAVPTTAEVKVERALELFNGSEHQRTIVGLARTLGAPWVSASPDAAQPSCVNVVVAWELSWYRYRVDLGDEIDPVALLDKGEELGELDEAERAWNAGMDRTGTVVTGEPVAREGGER